MSVNDQCFIDTNALIRATVSGAPDYEITRRVLEHLRTLKTSLWISRQVLREYTSVLTREQTYAKPVSAKQIASVLKTLISQFNIADENSTVTTFFIDLLETVEVGGKQVHDANIVATMRAYSIRQLLTYNVKDFERFSNYIQPIEPDQFAKMILLP